MPLIKSYLQQFPQDYEPAVLEIGVDRGVTLVALVAFLARTRPKFVALGIDIMIQEPVDILLRNLDLQKDQTVQLTQANSLEVIPMIVEQKVKFDVVLIDGDHNYFTVSEELKHLEDITFKNSIVVIDDYEGRWSERDLFYADRPGYEDVKCATAKVDTEKHGVKPAVDEWLVSHPWWKKSQPVNGEPVLLMRQDT